MRAKPRPSRPMRVLHSGLTALSPRSMMAWWSVRLTPTIVRPGDESWHQTSPLHSTDINDNNIGGHHQTLCPPTYVTNVIKAQNAYLRGLWGALRWCLCVIMIPAIIDPFCACPPIKVSSSVQKSCVVSAGLWADIVDTRDILIWRQVSSQPPATWWLEHCSASFDIL